MTKNIFNILLISLSLATSTGANNGVTTSFYYTHGNYSNNNRSDSYAGYISTAFSNSDYFIGAFDNLKINNNEWKYDQQMFSAAYTKIIFPIYLKFNFSYVTGKYNYKLFPYSYDDDLYTCGIKIRYNYNLLFFGVSYAYQDLKGFKSITTHQIKMNLDWLISTKINISINALYKTISDSRKLKSVFTQIQYKPFNLVSLSAGIMLGERAYFYDEDLLLIFNQDETQKKLFLGKLELNLSKNLSLPFIYQYSDFETYKIDFASAGITYKF